MNTTKQKTVTHQNAITNKLHNTKMQTQQTTQQKDKTNLNK